MSHADTTVDAEPVAIYDDVRKSAKTAAIATLFFVVSAVAAPALIATGIYYWAAWLLTVIVLVIGGGLLLQIVPRVRRRHTPFLTIRADGFVCPGLVEPLVSWSAIEHMRVSDDSIVCTDFFFKAAAMLPIRDRSRANVQLSRRRRQLSIRGPAPRDMSLEEYGNRLGAACEHAQGLAHVTLAGPSTMPEPHPS